MTMARVTITLPPELLEAADRRAEALDRSRSWLLVQALRAYLAGAAAGAGSAAAVREAPADGYTAGLGPLRRAQLEADLALEPEERVRAAEETARVAELRGPVAVRERVIVFGRHEDFLAWDKREVLGGG